MSKIVPISFHAVFQFHYGTIKSLPHPRSPKNSSYFNSTMVRLKARLEYLLPFANRYFNSTMVRLKVIILIVVIIPCFVFQFHYGTIKSVLADLSGNGHDIFQFHYGTIKRISLTTSRKRL